MLLGTGWIEGGGGRKMKKCITWIVQCQRPYSFFTRQMQRNAALNSTLTSLQLQEKVVIPYLVVTIHPYTLAGLKEYTFS